MVSSQWPVHAVPGKTPLEGKKRVLECRWGLPAPAYHQGPDFSPEGGSVQVIRAPRGRGERRGGRWSSVG
ncbi:hypothetical protein PC119_g9318 [Phytophthora cactorum]|nr:hypothetical protein PC119_g9318 [Phytophthora cactorum]